MDRDEMIRQMWSQYHDSQTGKTKWKGMAAKLDEMGARTLTGGRFTDANLRLYVMRHQPVQVTSPEPKGRDSGAVEDTAPPPPKAKKEQTETVEDTAQLPPEPPKHEPVWVMTSKGAQAVEDTAQLPSKQPLGWISRSVGDEQVYGLALPVQDWDTVMEMMEWFRSGPESLPHRKELPSGTRRFPETLPSYSGKTKDSLSLVSDRWKLALKRAQALWPNQKIEKGNLACWLVERFIAETEDQGNE